MNFFKPILNYFTVAPASDYIFYLAMIISVICSKRYYKKRELFINSIAAIGMIGTFYGICIGLQNFDSNNITKSVPELLSGMKTAFYTSLIGTLGSVALKILYGLFGTKIEPIEKEFFDNNVFVREQNDKIIFLLEKLVNNSYFFYKTFEEKTDKTNKFLEMNIEEFKTLREKMVKEHNEAFIESLNVCIKSLNKDLMEQLGENFNHFNEGMSRLVEWQNKYINIIKNTEKSQENIVNSFNNIKEELSVSVNSVKELSEYSKEIISICSNIKNIINQLENTIENTNEQINKLINIIKNITTINKDLIDFKNHLGSIIKDIGTSKGLFSFTNENLERLNKDLENYLTSTKQTHNIFNESMRKELNTAVSNINELNVKFNSDCGRIAENISYEMNTLNKEVGKLLEKHINNIETKLGESLTASLESLGDELATLSEKFTEDYTPLTDKLREIIRISEKVK